MKHKQLLAGIASACAMVVLILDGKTALEGAREGVQLCLVTMIPSLFPFFLLSAVLNRALLGTSAAALHLPARWLGIPKGAEGLVVASLLGGYPAGAQSVVTGYRQGCLTKDQTQRLLGLCNQPGPAFLFGILAQIFPSMWMVWVLWATVLVSAGMVALILDPGEESAGQAEEPIPRGDGNILWASLRAMGVVCGWVVVFRVILAFLDRWIGWLLPTEIQVAVTGMLELSNGCLALESIPSLPLRFCLAAGMLSFGGGCIALQTQSLAQGLSMKRYYLEKSLQGGFALALGLCICYGIWLPLAGIFGICLGFRKKSSRNSRLVGV